MEVTTPIKDWTVIKTKLFTPKQNFYGLLIIFFNNKKNTVENINIVFSIYSQTHEIDLSEDWSTLEATIQDMIYGGNYTKDITQTVLDKLTADTKTSIFGSDLKSSILRNNVAGVQTLIKHVLLRILNDESIEIDCQLQQVTNEELAAGRVRDADAPLQEDTKSEGMNMPEDYRLVHAKLILAPIDGKLTSELRIGDTLLVNLIVTSMTENTVIDKLKLRKPDGSAKPAPARIIKIQPYNKGIQLLLNLTENFYAKIIEEERVLVKTASVSAAGAQAGSARKNQQSPDKKKPAQKEGFSWVTVGIVVVLGIVILYMAFTGG